MNKDNQYTIELINEFYFEPINKGLKKENDFEIFLTDEQYFTYQSAYELIDESLKKDGLSSTAIYLVSDFLKLTVLDENDWIKIDVGLNAVWEVDEGEIIANFIETLSVKELDELERWINKQNKHKRL